MFTFCDVLHEQNKKHKQTLESAQYGLEISFKARLKLKFQTAVYI